MGTTEKKEPKRGQNSFMRSVHDLVIEDGLNLRQPTDEAIEEKKISIAANGVITDFQVYKKHGSEKYTIIEGHTRYLGIMKGIADGTIPKDILIPCKSAKFTSNIDIVLSMFTCNSGEPLPPISKAEGYRRLISYGKTVKDIHKALGVSENHINECLLLLNANSGLQSMVRNNKVSATLVAKKLKTQSSDAIEAEIKTALKQTGKDKVSEKHLPKQPLSTKVVQSRIDKEVSKIDTFRTWLNNNDYMGVLEKFNEIFR